MQKPIEAESLPLFDGAKDRNAALAFLLPRQAEYAKGEYILTAGERRRAFGVLLAGCADVVNEDAGGNPVTLARLSAGDMFAEAFAFSGEPLSVGVVAAERARVVWLDAERVAAAGEKFASVTAAALRMFARKNLFLTERIEHLSKHALADKVLSYLASERRRAGKAVFSLPFDRQGMADYLGCDRSALSAVLSKLKKRGALDYHKNTFRLP